MPYTASETRKPAYPCDICGQHVKAGERVNESTDGSIVEHATCTAQWFRSNFGREALR